MSWSVTCTQSDSLQPPCRSFVLYLIICLLIAGLTGCPIKEEPSLISPQTNPYFLDDGDRASLNSAIGHQVDYLKTRKDSYTQLIGGNRYSKEDLLESLDLFQQLLDVSPTAWKLNEKLREHFTILQAAGRTNRPWGEMLITGYFEPVLDGSLVKTDEYRYPIYRIPDNLVIRRGQGTKKEIGRFNSSGRLVPYWSRKEIEEQGKAKGFEMVYLKDPLDAFILHVQGSGKIRLTSGEIRKIRFGSSNGHHYNSIGKLLADEGKIERNKVSIPTIRAYLDAHPQDQQRVFFHNPRFIFFQWSKNDHVIGSLGSPLTAGRSIAIDHSVLPTGAIGFLVGRMPLVGRGGQMTRWIQMSRFVLPQDSGSAIKGAGRADIFWGSGTYAEAAAGSMNEKGSLYFLVKKR